MKSYFEKKSASLKSSFLVGGRWSKYTSFFCFEVWTKRVKRSLLIGSRNEVWPLLLSYRLRTRCHQSDYHVLHILLIISLWEWTLFTLNLSLDGLESHIATCFILALMLWYALLTVEILWHRSDPTWQQGEVRQRLDSHLSIWRIFSMLHHGWPLFNRRTSGPGFLSESGFGHLSFARSRLWVTTAGKKSKMCVS